MYRGIKFHMAYFIGSRHPQTNYMQPGVSNPSQDSVSRQTVDLLKLIKVWLDTENQTPHEAIEDKRESRSRLGRLLRSKQRQQELEIQGGNQENTDTFMLLCTFIDTRYCPLVKDSAQTDTTTLEVDSRNERRLSKRHGPHISCGEALKECDRMRTSAEIFTCRQQRGCFG